MGVLFNMRRDLFDQSAGHMQRRLQLSGAGPGRG